ncbi:hypothetical protein BH23ACI1_BH23ACI1_31470 [soil metagenome]
MITILIATLSFATAVMSPDGSVTGVSVAPSKVSTGERIAITVTGTNPCGAVHIITGDGAAVTHAITGLPSTHEHTYRRPGRYTIVAQGMGDCDGEATTTVHVTGKPLDRDPPPPPPPPAPRAEITNVEMAPVPGRVREPVTFTISGSGNCDLSVEFGDGNSRRLTGSLPQRVTYTYSVARRYTVIVRPTAPCEGRFTQELDVVDPEPAGQLSRVTVSPAPARAGEPVAIRLEGTGRCAYTVDFGDGNAEPREGTLPEVVTRYYQAPGMYTVTARPQAPCRGGDRVTFEVRGTARGNDIISIDFSPARPSPGGQVTFTIRGTGECRVTIDFGDGSRRTYVGTLPMRVPHVYDWAGSFIAEATGEAPCAGSARVRADVR